MYKVLIDFSDPVDGGVYRAGDAYPRDGVKPSAERIKYLSGSTNKIGKPVIDKVADPKTKDKE